ncbi:hypothetical protein GQX73_g3411 [Xylaria multiplex]|uniref:Uncharacterized protein n=1 Tax=Xylaria multiplex TaxID=323545 RepID=A0A7C8N0J4_9PEZI|nr:hypothetical protein GQX73_g3411 [Xylaria multiplex]
MSATVTPSMRTAGWNVEFTIGSADDPDIFAGIYQAPGSNLVTFSDVCDEMRLCFDLIASVPQQVDRRALRQHYEMSCIENMAALKVYWRDSLSKTNAHTSGTQSVLSPSTDFPPTPGSRDTELGTFLRGASDPSKKTPPTPPNQGQPGDTSGQDNLVTRAKAVLRQGETGYKRKRIQECEVDTQTFPRYEEDMQDSYITPRNSREFLADVNWELQRFKGRQHARGNFV